MVTGDPLRIEQHHLAGPRLYWNLFVYPFHPIYDVGEVDPHLDWANIRLIGRCNDRRRHRYRLGQRLSSILRHGARGEHGRGKQDQGGRSASY